MTNSETKHTSFCETVVVYPKFSMLQANDFLFTLFCTSSLRPRLLGNTSVTPKTDLEYCGLSLLITLELEIQLNPSVHS